MTNVRMSIFKYFFSVTQMKFCSSAHNLPKTMINTTAAPIFRAINDESCKIIKNVLKNTYTQHKT